MPIVGFSTPGQAVRRPSLLWEMDSFHNLLEISARSSRTLTAFLIGTLCCVVELRVSGYQDFGYQDFREGLLRLANMHQSANFLEKAVHFMGGDM